MENSLKKKFCGNCGEALSPDVKFCPNCGSPCSPAVNAAGDNAAHPAPTVMDPTAPFGGFMGMGGVASFAPDAPSFHLSLSGGMMMNSGRTYIAEKNGDFVRVRIRLEGVALKDAPAFPADVSFFDQLEQILLKNNVRAWDGFNERDQQVMDGSGFSLRVRMRDGATVSADGYMRYPSGFGVFLQEITDLFIALYETRFPNYARVLDAYYKKELLPLCGDLTEGAAFEYGYISEGNGQFSYGEDTLSGGVVAKIVGNFHLTDRDRAARDMAVFFLRKRTLEDRNRDVTALKVEFSTVDGDMQIRELGHADLSTNLFWCDSVRGRVFSAVNDGKFSIGYYSHSVNRFWDLPDALCLTLFTFDGECVSVAFSDAVRLDLSSKQGEKPSARDFPEMGPFLKALADLGYARTVENWCADFSDPDLSLSEIQSHVRISAFGTMNRLYENLMETPAGETVKENRLHGFVQPGM